MGKENIVKKFVNKFSVFFLIYISGCASLSDIRRDGPIATYNSSKNAKDFTACVAESWEGVSSTMTVNSRHTSNGYIVSLYEKVWGGNNVLFLLDAEDNSAGSVSRLYKGYVIADKFIKMVEACR